MSATCEQLNELKQLHDLPLMELLAKAHGVHTQYYKVGEIQTCKLISIKTGGCTEDCKYCSQSKYHKTSVRPQRMMQPDEVVAIAEQAVTKGARRICLASAWRGIKQGKPFSQIVDMVRRISNLGVEVCCSLGLLTEEEAQLLADAGLFAYNHNLDSSREFYKTIITSRTYDDRLQTLQNVQKARLHVCCGGIIGMGESIEDRLNLILTLKNLKPNPNSVPINMLEAIPGTPLERQHPANVWELLRIVAVTRISLPKSTVRLSAGRQHLSLAEQALCFFAGVNSIFIGNKLLTTKNTVEASDKEMFEILGLKTPL